MSATFDDDSLLPCGGLAVAGLLAQRLGVAELVDEHVRLSAAAAANSGANSGAKALTVVGSALAGGDCIDDVAVLQAGATPRLFDGVWAPSTIGTWLRSFTWAGVCQLDRARELAGARLGRRPGPGPGR